MTKTGPIDVTLLLEQRMDYERRLRSERELEQKSLVIENSTAMITEVSELMNEWKQFKYWQKKLKPGSRRKQLEEYADGLHIIMALFGEKLEEMPGLLKYEYHFPEDDDWHEDHEIMKHFITVCEDVSYLEEPYDYNYRKLLQDYMELGSVLGFTWDEVVKAYLRMLKKNIKRLDNGY